MGATVITPTSSVEIHAVGRHWYQVSLVLFINGGLCRYVRTYWIITVPVGRTTVNLYPVIDPSMQVHEHANAFQINNTALASLPVNLRVQLDMLGQQLNLADTVD